MKRLAVCAVFAAGCSNAPVAGFLDCVAPSKARPGAGIDRPPPAGGTWDPTAPSFPPRTMQPDTLPPPADLAPRS